MPTVAIVAAGKPDKKKRLTFDIPEGLDLEGKGPGDMLEVVAGLKIEEDGKLCLKVVNGIELEGYEKEKEKRPPSFADAVGGEPEENY